MNYSLLTSGFNLFFFFFSKECLTYFCLFSRALDLRCTFCSGLSSFSIFHIITAFLSQGFNIHIRLTLAQVDLSFFNIIVMSLQSIQQGVLQAHDSIAAKDFAPHLPEIPVEVDEDEETVKIVQLVKSNEPMVGIKSACVTIVAVIIVTARTVHYSTFHCFNSKNITFLVVMT